jgi:hypothetical protein
MVGCAPLTHPTGFEIVTVNETPAFQFGPLDQDDDLIDRLLEHNPAFRRTLIGRHKEISVSAEEAAKRL